MQTVTSSQIHSVGYDAAKKHLHIRFHGRSGAPGSLYHYFGVPPETHEALLKAESVGSHFGKHVKGKFEFKKIEEQQAQG